MSYFIHLLPSIQLLLLEFTLHTLVVARSGKPRSLKTIFCSKSMHEIWIHSWKSYSINLLFINELLEFENVLGGRRDVDDGARFGRGELWRIFIFYFKHFRYNLVATDVASKVLWISPLVLATCRQSNTMVTLHINPCKVIFAPKKSEM